MSNNGLIFLEQACLLSVLNNVFDSSSHINDLFHQSIPRINLTYLSESYGFLPDIGFISKLTRLLILVFL